MRRLFQDEEHKDFTLKLISRDILVHSVIILARAPRMYKLWTTPKQRQQFNYPIEVVNPLLEFLYTGVVRDLDTSVLLQLSELAVIYDLSSLVNICTNLMQKKGNVISFHLNSLDLLKCNLVELPQKMSSDYAVLVNNKELADVIFHIEGTIIYAHKNILAARSSVFRAMFASGFKESQQDVVNFTLEGISVEACKSNNTKLNLELIYKPLCITYTLGN